MSFVSTKPDFLAIFLLCLARNNFDLFHYIHVAVVQMQVKFNRWMRHLNVVMIFISLLVISITPENSTIQCELYHRLLCAEIMKYVVISINLYIHSCICCCVWSTVYPKKYAHGFCFAVLCCGYTLTDFPISIRLTSLALWQSNDCPSASKATLMNMDKHFMWIHYERLHSHNKAKHNKTMCIFLGIYCTKVQVNITLIHPWGIALLRYDCSCFGKPSGRIMGNELYSK